MAEVTYKGKTFEVDEDGFLLKFDEWCPEWLEYVKESEGITDLNEDHQKILDFLQDYYRKNGIAPMVRILSKNTGKPIEVVTADCERDNFMTAQEAMEYGLIDKVFDKH